MRMYDIIAKKRDGGTLTRAEIAFAVNGYVDGSVPDYQMSALLMLEERTDRLALAKCA